MEEKFVKTNDDETYHALIKCGLRFITKEGSVYVFENNSKILFSDNIDNTKVTYSNKLTF